MIMQQANGHDPAGLPPDAIKLSMRDIAIAELGVRSLARKIYPAGTLMMNPDAQVRYVYFIVAGRVRVYRLSPTGEQIFYDELGAGDCLSDLALVGDHRPAFVQAVADSTVELLPESDFFATPRTVCGLHHGSRQEPVETDGPPGPTAL